MTRRCAFWGFRLHCYLFWGVKSPEKPNFGGVNRRFQAKRAKNWKFHVIETPASILTKFCTTMETIKWSSRVVRIGAQQIQDGGRPPFWKKPLNRHISAIVWPILIRFGTMTHIIMADSHTLELVGLVRGLAGCARQIHEIWQWLWSFVTTAPLVVIIVVRPFQNIMNCFLVHFYRQSVFFWIYKYLRHHFQSSRSYENRQTRTIKTLSGT